MIIKTIKIEFTTFIILGIFTNIIIKSIMSTDKQQILEPITAMARLITLAFKPIGTKISIRDHNVVLCEPNNNVYNARIPIPLPINIPIPQGVNRYLNGDSREDIFVLNHALCNFIEWYIIPYKKLDPTIYDGLINMARYLRVGLRVLQKTYKTGNAVGTLQYYILILTALIDGHYTPDMLYGLPTLERTPGARVTTNVQNTFFQERTSFLDDPHFEGESTMYSTIFDVNKLKSFWNVEELKSLCNQFDMCFVHSDEPDIPVWRFEEMYANTNMHNAHNSYNSDNEADDNSSSLTANDIISEPSNDINNQNTTSSNSKSNSTDLGVQGLYVTSEDEYIGIPSPSASPPAYQAIQPMQNIQHVQHVQHIQQTQQTQQTPKKISHGAHISHPNPNIKKNNHTSSNMTYWPSPKSRGNLLVQSYLLGIDNILAMMDRRFTSMLNQSIKGGN